MKRNLYMAAAGSLVGLFLVATCVAAQGLGARADVDGDGRLDSVFAIEGEPALFWRPGDGRGGFGSPRRAALDGLVTALAAGGRLACSGPPRLAVAVAGQHGPHLLLIDPPALGGVRALALPGRADDLHFGDADGDGFSDLVIVTIDTVLLLPWELLDGQARDLGAFDASSPLVPVPAPFAAVAAVAGRMGAGGGAGLALMGPQGELTWLPATGAGDSGAASACGLPEVAAGTWMLTTRLDATREALVLVDPLDGALTLFSELAAGGGGPGDGCKYVRRQLEPENEPQRVSEGDAPAVLAPAEAADLPPCFAPWRKAAGLVAADDAATTPEDTTVVIPVLDNDQAPAGSELSILFVSPSATGTPRILPDRTLSYTPRRNVFGRDVLTYTIGNGSGMSASAQVVIDILPVPDPPEARNDFAITPEDQSVDVAVLANDRDGDGDPLQLVAVTQPLRGTAGILPGGIVHYEPSPNFSGVLGLRYTVSDGALSAEGRITITVEAVNDPPTLADDEVTVAEDQAVSIAVLANDRDVDFDPLTVLFVGSSASATVRLQSDQQVLYTPHPDVFGHDAFVYAVSDGIATRTATVRVTIAAVPDAPIAVDDTATTAAGVAVDVAVLANDRDPDLGTLAIAALHQGQGGDAELLAGGLVRFTPAPGFVGDAYFEYTVTNASGAFASALVVITIEPIAGGFE